MDLTSYQAEAAEFREVRRGFDPTEVAQFQQRVVRAMRSYERELHDTQRRLTVLESERVRAGAAQDGAERAFLAGVEAKQSIIARAQREAAELVNEAKRTAAQERERLDDAAARSRAGLIAELERLRAEASGLAGEMSDGTGTPTDGGSRDAAAGAALEVAAAEAEMIVAGARDEARKRLQAADEIRAEAERAAAAGHATVARDDSDRVERERRAQEEIAALRSTITAAEASFRRAVDEALTGLESVRAGLDRVAAPLGDDGDAAAPEGTELTIDLRPEPAPSGQPASFYEKRLAGLRQRLEDDTD